MNSIKINYEFINNEIKRFSNIINNIAIHINYLKKEDVLCASQINQCNSYLYDLYNKIYNINYEYLLLHDSNFYYNEEITNKFINDIQIINNELSNIVRLYGAYYFKDLITICFGNQFINNIHNQTDLSNIWNLLCDNFHPISYHTYNWKNLNEPYQINDILKKHNIKNNENENEKQNQTINNINNNNNNNIDIKSNIDIVCYDLSSSSKNFFLKINGILTIIQYPKLKKTLVIAGYIDNLPIWGYMYNDFNNTIKFLKECCNSNNNNFNILDLERYIDCLTIKDYILYKPNELWNRFVGFLSQAKLYQTKSINILIKEFLSSDIYNQRNILLYLLIRSHQTEYKYLSYLLFDLLSNDNGNNIDSYQQTLIFNSLPNKCKFYFKDALQSTIEYSSQLNNYDINKIPFEQQICLLKANENVKEKAMSKLKEIKNKNEDSGSKARQYLEGLLKIPFGIYKTEPILHIMNDTKNTFKDLIFKLQDTHFKCITNNIPLKNTYTSIEINNYINKIRNSYNIQVTEKTKSLLLDYLSQNLNRVSLINIIKQINKFIKINSINHKKIPHSGKSINQMEISVRSFIEKLTDYEWFLTLLGDYLNITKSETGESLFNIIGNDLRIIEKNIKDVNKYMVKTNNILTNAVHGHDKAKRQIERIIGQWINGEQTGYCFGFEGPPGVGKTSLAKKGIAKCLEDKDGVTRPFSFIAIGGASNGSTLEGHNYTYVASTWGKIVDILMDKKCMNPIIFIDELDKVSKTEHGKEIIGILTHLIDPTQNDTFQDKYFNGIELDLSKALFIFSYNDVDNIDRILLDRIHRVKFSPLTIDDKLIITRKYVLKEILEKMGMVDMIDIDDEVITYIIDSYTCEPGVRKLKELIFEIVGEINLSTLKNNNVLDIELPIKITIDDIKNKYLKDRDIIIDYKINRYEPTIGVINGLYANSLGMGGVLPIEISLTPSNSFLDLHLTGLQGDVMKESMNVAKTLAIMKANEYDNCIKDLCKSCKGLSYKYGLHIHVPSGATKKDGPSAGTAITIAIYSLLTKRPIKQDVAITGEICLSGLVTAIGGLEHKIIGGIKAGVKTFIYPEENQTDFNKIMEIHGKKEIFNNINFFSVKTLEEAMKIVF